MSDDTQTPPAADDSAAPADTVSAEAFKKLQDRAQRFEALAKEAEKRYAQFASMYKDIDPDEAKALKAKLEEAEKKAAEKDPAKMEELFERKLTKYRNEYESEKTQLTQKLEQAAKELKSLKVTDKVMSEIGHLFNKDALKFIKREVEELCDLDDDGTIVVKDDDGQPLFKGGKYLGIKDFGEILVEKYPSLATPQGTGGSKDITPGTKVSGRVSGKDPQSYAELQAMGAAGKEWLDNARRTPEGQAKVQKILETM